MLDIATSLFLQLTQHFTLGPANTENHPALPLQLQNTLTGNWALQKHKSIFSSLLNIQPWLWLPHKHLSSHPTQKLQDLPGCRHHQNTFKNKTEEQADKKNHLFLLLACLDKWPWVKSYLFIFNQNITLVVHICCTCSTKISAK